MFSVQANGADIRGGTWFETGAEMLNGGTLNYFAVPWGIINNPLPLFLVTIIEVGLLGAAEKYRCACRVTRSSGARLQCQARRIPKPRIHPEPIMSPGPGPCSKTLHAASL